VVTETRQENYYRLLNVEYTATSSEITHAYREAVKRAHPDRAVASRRAAAEEITKDLNRAYSVLSNPERRRAYDRTIRKTEVQDRIMNRYVSGLGTASPSTDPFATHLKRPMTEREKQERRRSERSAMYSLLSVFVVLLLGGLGLLAMFALVTYLISLI
jgi:DnaJ-class molecular chaperone